MRRDIVRVKHHENGGFTKVILEWTEGLGIADGGIEWEIPTSIIPVRLRGIGTRFSLIEDPSYTQPQEVNVRYKNCRVEELS